MDLTKLQLGDYVKLDSNDVLAYGDFVLNHGIPQLTVRVGERGLPEYEYFRPKYFPLADDETIKRGDLCRGHRERSPLFLISMSVGDVGDVVRKHSARFDYFRPNPAYQPQSEAKPVPAAPKPIPELPDRWDAYEIHRRKLIAQGIETAGPSRLTTPTRTPVAIYVQEQHPDAPDVGAKDAR